MSFSPAPGTLLSIYQYESVDISVSYSGTGTYTYTTTGSTDVISSLVSATSPIVRLTTLSYNGSVPKLGTESLVVNVIDTITKTPVASATYPVFFGSGRFLPFEYNPNISNGSNIVLYVNEAFKPIRFQTQQLGINSPSVDVNSVPTSLPVGLGLVKIASNIYDLSGTPAAQTVSRNYRFFSTGASNASFVVSNLASIVVNSERVVLNPPGPTLSFSSLAVGSSIPSTTITATYPSNAIGNLLYTWTTLPPGFFFTDPNGNVISGNSMYSRDSNSTLTLTGTATIDTLNFFVANGNPFTTTLKAVRQTQPLISNALGFQFSFQPSVILTPPVVNTQYVGVPFIPSRQPLFNAYSSFGSTSPISTIFSPNLISDLSVNFNPSTATASLNGTPRLANVPGGFYTFRAVNATGLSTDISVNIPIALDTVSMSTTMDPVTTFILSRDSSNAKTGYYKAPLQFTAYAASGNSVTFSAPALSGTGLSLSNVTPNTVQIVGTPTRTTGLTGLVVTATAANTNATSALSTQFSIVNDIVTLGSFSVSAIQNIPITPIQVTASSLSERNVISFTGSNFPPGLFISTTGIISGTVLSSTGGNLTVYGSTGYASGSLTTPYTVTPDNVLLFAAQASYTIVPGTAVSANITGASFSGGVVSNYRFCNLTNTYGLTINSNSGAISGTLFDGIPPNVLPASCNFQVYADSGSASAFVPGVLTTINSYLCNQYLVKSSLSNESGDGLLVSSRVLNGDPNPYIRIAHGNDDNVNYPNDFILRPNPNGINGRFLFSYTKFSVTAPSTPVTTPFVMYSDNGVNYGKTPETAFVDANVPFLYYDSSSNPTTSSATPQLASVNALIRTSSTNVVTVGYVGAVVDGTFRTGTCLFSSSNDGVSWSRTDFGYSSESLIFSRSGNGSNYASESVSSSTLSNSYLIGGFATSYDSSRARLLVGGASLGPTGASSSGSGSGGTTGGSQQDTPVDNYGYLDIGSTITWTPSSSSPFAGEIAFLNADVPGVFVATGTSAYSNITILNRPIADLNKTANTVAYSTNGGTSWSPGRWTGSDSSFNFIGGEIASDGTNTWLATGVRAGTAGSSGGSTTFQPLIAYSIGGSNWSTFNLPDQSTNFPASTDRLYPPLPIGPLYFNKATLTWHVFVLIVSGTTKTIIEYIHDNVSLFTNPDTWSSITTNFDSTLQGNVDLNTRLIAARPTVYGKSPNGDILSTLSFSSYGVNGPILDSPAYTNLTLVQYIPMTPVVFSAHSSPGSPPGGTIYYYVSKGSLPIGISFNPQTRVLSGTPAHVGTSLIPIFIKDSNGTSTYTLTITVLFPSVTTRPLTGAGAYTSYIRQFTLADAAQNSRNNKVLTESDTLGEFMAPYGGDSISATIDPKCKNPLC